MKIYTVWDHDYESDNLIKAFLKEDDALEYMYRSRMEKYWDLEEIEVV